MVQQIVRGGSVWESNPPVRLLTRPARFEDESGHQARSAPSTHIYFLISFLYLMRCGISASAPSLRFRSAS